jgi:hypothetical protein
MTTTTKRRAEVSRRAALGCLLLALLVSACADTPPQAGAGAAAQPSDRGPVVAASDLADVRAFRSIRPDPTVPLPVAVTIPAIGVDSDLQRLGRDAQGAIEIPSAWSVAGWYAEGVRPGQVGPAVIIGHVDSTQGPAVFYRLRELGKGDEIKVTRADGSVATFVVDRLEQHAKTRFPTDDVYLPTLEPTLRLVTCDGVFDRSTGHYRDNLVVFAALRS